MRINSTRWWLVAIGVLTLCLTAWAAESDESAEPESTTLPSTTSNTESTETTETPSSRPTSRPACRSTSRPSKPARKITASPRAWPPRAIWVTRRTWQNPQQIRTLIEKCANAGFNTVLFQVRGNGTVYYDSKIEPLAAKFSDGQCDFDPLAVAIEAAHESGIALHAWINLLPAWSGTEPPSDPNQLYNAHPQWFLYDQNGKRQPLGWYVCLNPCLPEVRQYLVRVCQEILREYKVDGLHLDYVRLALEKSPKDSDYPRDDLTLKLYAKGTRHLPDDDEKLWTAWRSAQISQLLYEIRVMARRTRPRAYLSAACMSNLDNSGKYFQDPVAWVRCALLDLVYVMNYTSNIESFTKAQDAWLNQLPDGPIVPGLSVFNRDSQDATIQQLLLAEHWEHGFAIFSDTGLFDGSRESTNAAAELLPDLQNMSDRMEKAYQSSRNRFDGRVTRNPINPRKKPLLPPDPPQVIRPRSQGGRSRSPAKITDGPAKPAIPAIPATPTLAVPLGSTGDKK